MGRVVAAILLIISFSHAKIFDEGSMAIGVAVGTGVMEVNSKEQSYTLAGAHMDYFVIDNLSVGVGYLGWFGDKPTLSQYTIPLTYYYPFNERYRPYGGLFWRYNQVSDGYESYSSYGARLGLAMRFSQKIIFGVGVVSEHYGSDAMHKDASSSYPELFFAFIF